MDDQFTRAGVSNNASRGDSSTAAPVHLDTMTVAPSNAAAASIQNAPEVASPPTAPSAPTPESTPPPGTAQLPPEQYVSESRKPLRYKAPSRFSPRLRLIGVIMLVLAILIGGVIVLFSLQQRKGGESTVDAADFDSLTIPLGDLAKDGSVSVGGKTLSVNGQLRANGSLIMTPAAQPSQPTNGQIYYDQTSNHLSYYNGTEFVQLQTNQDAQGTTNTTNTTNSINNITNLTVNAGTVTTTNPIGGTTGKIAKFTSGQALGDSMLTDQNTYLQVDGGINLTAASSTTDLTLFKSTITPTIYDTGDNHGEVELGVKFQVDVPGVVKSIRFYKGASENGTFTGSLWTTTGTQLATATFTSITSSGWQQVDFATPVPVSPDTTYVASYHVQSSGGTLQPIGYPYEEARFGASGIDNGPLHGLASGLDGGNGVFRYGGGGVPLQTFNSSNYFVDVVFAGSVYTTDSRIRINDAQLSSSDLVNDANLAKRGSSQVFSAHNIFRNASDSVNEFSIQKADTTELFSADSANGRIYIGPQTGGGNILLVLNNKITDGDVANATDGAMYYQAADGVYRCYANNLWSNCSDPQITRSYTLNEEFMGGAADDFTTNHTFGSLGWKAEAIGANGSIDFNPATPAPIADRPGVLALTSPASANQGTTLMLGKSTGGSMLLRKSIVVQTAVAMGSNTDQVMRIGLHTQSTSTTQPVSGVWWEADPNLNANWRYCHGDGTTATCVNTLNPVTPNAWVRLGVRIVSTGTGTSEVVFTFGTNTYNASSVTIDTTNRVSPALSCYTLAASAKSCYWDYFQLTGITSAIR